MEEKKGCTDVGVHALKGEVMPLRWCPCNDFTSPVALLDPDTPTQPSQQIPVPIGLLRMAAMEIWTEPTETERVKTEGSGAWWWSRGGTMKKGLCKRSTVGQRFLLACRGEGT